MSEIVSIFDLGAVVAEEKAKAKARVLNVLDSLSTADLHLLADAVVNHYGHYGRTAPQFQSANGGLPASLMKQLGVKVRVAVWEMRDGRCEHKRYAVGSTTRAKIGEIGDAEWIAAWIA